MSCSNSVGTKQADRKISYHWHHNTVVKILTALLWCNHLWKSQISLLIYMLRSLNAKSKPAEFCIPKVNTNKSPFLTHVTFWGLTLQVLDRLMLEKQQQCETTTKQLERETVERNAICIIQIKQLTSCEAGLDGWLTYKCSSKGTT